MFQMLACHQRLFHTVAHMMFLYISLNITHSDCKPSNFMSSFTHSFQVFLLLTLHFTPATSFYRLTPNHSHSYASDAQTLQSVTPFHICHTLYTQMTVQLYSGSLTSICHASPHSPHSVYPNDCTNPHCAFYHSATLHTSISPSSTLSSPDFADFQPSSPMFQSHMSTLSGQKFSISFPLCGVMLMHHKLSVSGKSG